MRTHPRERRGVAAVEFAFVLPVLFTLLIGAWQMGRIIQVQQILTNAAREGARIAAQGQTINTTGSYTQIQVTSGTPNVQQVALDYLKGAGITNTTGATVTFQFLNGNTGNTQPYQATKNQLFQVTVTIPYNNVRISPIDLLSITTLSGTVQWVAMVDDPFSVNTSIPTWTAFQ